MVSLAIVAGLVGSGWDRKVRLLVVVGGCRCLVR